MNVPLITVGQDDEVDVPDGGEFGNGETFRCNAASGNLLSLLRSGISSPNPASHHVSRASACRGSMACSKDHQQIDQLDHHHGLSACRAHMFFPVAVCPQDHLSPLVLSIDFGLLVISCLQLLR